MRETQGFAGLFFMTFEDSLVYILVDFLDMICMANSPQRLSDQSCINYA